MKLPRPLARAGAPFALALSALSFTALAETHAPTPNPLQGDGRVSPFYTWEKAIPATPGKLLRSEPLDATLSLAGAASQQRVLYTSTDGIDGKTPIVVSGALFLPKGKAPAGGWPVVSWGHGTVGVADVCAPSWQGRSIRDVNYLNAWLKEGYAVVATDYQGLGVPGGHPLLNSRAAAYGILDAAKAVVNGTQGLANKVLIVGQSQGGAGAFAAATYAPAYTPDLGVKGTVATGVIYKITDSKNRPAKDPNKVDETIAYSFYTQLAQQQYDPSISPADYFTDDALPLVEQARTSCLFALEGDTVFTGRTPANTQKKPSPQAAAKLKPWVQAIDFPTLKAPQPIFIGAGQTDPSTTAASQSALSKDACAAGSIIEAHVYAGLEHSGTVNASLKDSIPFARKVLNGEKITPICDPTPQ